MRMRKKKNLLPRMEACRACQVQDPFAMRGHWRELMPDARELRVELGCGKGRFTVGTAQAEPDVLLIAVEKVPDAMVVAMERAQAAGLHNVFFVVGDAALLPDMFAPAEVDRLQDILYYRALGVELAAIHQLLRPVAQEQPEAPPFDPRQFSQVLPAGAAYGRADPL